MPEDGEDCSASNRLLERSQWKKNLLLGQHKILDPNHPCLATQEVFTPTPGGKVMTAKDWQTRSLPRFYGKHRTSWHIEFLNFNVLKPKNWRRVFVGWTSKISKQSKFIFLIFLRKFESFWFFEFLLFFDYCVLFLNVWIVYWFFVL